MTLDGTFDGTFKSASGGSGPSLAEVERECILETLSRCDGNRTRAAKVLKISLRSLRMKLQYYALTGSIVPGPARVDEMQRRTPARPKSP